MNFSRPDMIINNTNSIQSHINSIQFYKDDRTFITRSTDNAMRIWDIRNTK